MTTVAAASAVDDHDEIRRLIDWNDDTTYHWVLRDETPSAIEYLGGVATVAIVLPGIVWGLLWFLGSMWESVAFWTALVATGVLAMTVVVYIYLSWNGSPEEQIQARPIRYFTATFLLGCVIYIISSSSFPIADGFSGDVGSARQWLLFFADGALRVVTFDAIEILDARLTNLAPVSSEARLSALLFKVLVTLGVVDMAISIFHGSLRSKSFYATVRECYWTCDEHEGTTA